MPSAIKKRQGCANKSNKAAALATQQGIQAFGRISKSRVQVTSGQTDQKVPNGKKRKFGSIEESCIEECRNHDLVDTTTPDHRKKSAIPLPDSKSVPIASSALANRERPLKKTCRPQHVNETPTKGATSLLKSLSLPSSSPSSLASSPNPSRYDTPPSSPTVADEVRLNHCSDDDLPDELQDLIDLHSSFLTALSLHFAHNGPTIPADSRNLVPGIERSWKKRRITIEDIQRILALEQGQGDRRKGNQQTGAVCLSNYGHGKICIELVDLSTCTSIHKQPFNEAAMNAIFIQNLQTQWSSYKSTQPLDPSPTAFISSLPLLPITKCASLTKIAPLLSKGQRRLEDLKAGAIKSSQPSPLNPITANTTLLPPQQQQKGKQTIARSTDLFSRLKAKQLHQGSLPPSPSSILLARKSALQRLPDVAPILEGLAISANKHCNDDIGIVDAPKSRPASIVSFSMPTLLQHLQMSLRNPIEREEAVDCVKLLAEVVPEWVGVRTVGKLVTVTIRGVGVGREGLRRRIEGFDVEDGL